MAEKRQRKNISVCGIYKNGFTLIEIMVAIMIIGLMATIVVPQLWRRAAGYERKQFIGKLSALTRFAKQQALTKNHVQQLFFDLKAGTITIKEKAEGKDGQGEQQFVPLKGAAFATSIKIPAQLQIKQFLIEGSDAMSAFSGKPTERIWFFIIPEGLSQNVIINMIDTKQLFNGKPRPIGLVLNPFTVQFKVYDEFQK